MKDHVSISYNSMNIWNRTNILLLNSEFFAKYNLFVLKQFMDTSKIHKINVFLQLDRV